MLYLYNMGTVPLSSAFESVRDYKTNTKKNTKFHRFLMHAIYTNSR